MGCSDSPSPIPLHTVRHVALRYRRLRDGHDGVSQVPGGPSRSCPALRPRWNPRALTKRTTLSRGVAVRWRLSPLSSASVLPRSLSRRLAARWILPSAKMTASASTMANTFGAQSHGLSARCLRFPAFLPGLPVVRPRKTRLPAGGQPLLHRLISGSGPREVSASSTSLPPHPGFAWRTIVPWRGWSSS